MSRSNPTLKGIGSSGIHERGGKKKTFEHNHTLSEKSTQGRGACFIGGP